MAVVNNQKKTMQPLASNTVDSIPSSVNTPMGRKMDEMLKQMQEQRQRMREQREANAQGNLFRHKQIGIDSRIPGRRPSINIPTSIGWTPSRPGMVPNTPAPIDIPTAIDKKPIKPDMVPNTPAPIDIPTAIDRTPAKPDVLPIAPSRIDIPTAIDRLPVKPETDIGPAIAVPEDVPENTGLIDRDAPDISDDNMQPIGGEVPNIPDDIMHPSGGDAPGVSDDNIGPIGGDVHPIDGEIPDIVGPGGQAPEYDVAPDIEPIIEENKHDHVMNCVERTLGNLVDSSNAVAQVQVGE